MVKQKLGKNSHIYDLKPLQKHQLYNLRFSICNKNMSLWKKYAGFLGHRFYFMMVTYIQTEWNKIVASCIR